VSRARAFVRAHKLPARAHPSLVHAHARTGKPCAHVYAHSRIRMCRARLRAAHVRARPCEGCEHTRERKHARDHSLEADMHALERTYMHPAVQVLDYTIAPRTGSPSNCGLVAAFDEVI